MDIFIKKIGDAILSSYKFVQLDVFTDQAFAGNPLAVFPEALKVAAQIPSVASRDRVVAAIKKALGPSSPQPK